MVVNRPGRDPRFGADILKTDGIVASSAELTPAGTQQRLKGGLGMTFAK
jgi:hypothetical protein